MDRRLVVGGDVAALAGSDLQYIAAQSPDIFENIIRQGDLGARTLARLETTCKDAHVRLQTSLPKIIETLPLHSVFAVKTGLERGPHISKEPNMLIYHCEPIYCERHRASPAAFSPAS